MSFKDKYNRPLKQRFLDSKFHTWLRNWKPIALCWWFIKHGRPIPKYLVGHAVFTLNQVGYRFRQDNGTETTATWHANQNTAWSPSITGDTTFRLRFELNEVGAAAGNVSAQLQYNINGIAWATADTTTNGIRIATSSNITDGVATTNQLTAGSGTFRAGQVRETATAATATMSGSDHTEVEFVLALHYGFLNTGDVVTFRVLDSGGLITYTVTPTINVTKVFNNPPTVALNTTDATNFGTGAIELEATATDPTPNDVEYGLHVDTASNFQGNETLDFSTTTITNGYSLRTGGAARIGQTFTATTSARVRRTRFFLWKSGAPTVRLVSKIYNTSGGLPTGDAIATSYTSQLSSDLLLTIGNGQWIDFYFLDDTDLSSGTVYAATCEVVVGSGTDDASNFTVITGSASSVVAGNYVAYSGGSWGSSSTIDIGCYIYTGEPAYTAVSSVGSGWANTVTPGDTNPFTTGQKVKHTLQSHPGTGTFYYRFTAKDPTGGNNWAWSPTSSRTFIAQEPGPTVRAVGQYEKNATTPVPVGDPTENDGITDNLYLASEVAYRTSQSSTFVPSIEIEQTGTAFNNVATQSQKSRVYYNQVAQPIGKRGGTLIYDSHNKRYIFFGGYDGTTRYNEVWEKYVDVPGRTWRRVTVSGTPPSGRNLHGAVYVKGNLTSGGAVRAYMVVWSGADPNDLNDMWSLRLDTPGSEAWQLITQTSAPTARSYMNGHMVATPGTDTSNNYIYMFGGWAASRENNLVRCTFDVDSPTAVTWTTLKANGAVGNPSARTGVVMGYKASTGKIYMYGGYTGSAMLSEFWEYDIAGNTWTNTSPSGTAPTGSETAAGGYDATNNRFWFTGGWTTNGNFDTGRNNIGYISDVGGSEAYVEVRAHEAYSGGNQSYLAQSFSAYTVDPDKGWLVIAQQAAGDATEPIGRYNYVIDFNEGVTSDYPVYGLSDGEFLSARDAMAHVWNPDASEWVVIGGFDDMADDGTINNGSHSGDIWTYNPANNTWRFAVAGFKTPPQMEGSMAVYDTTRDRILLFGGLAGLAGNANSVYELVRDTYGNYKTTQLRPTGTKPAPRWLGATTYDATNDRAVFLFGGNASGPINNAFALTFTGSSQGAWSTLTPSGTAPTATTAMAFARDPSSNRLYVHGGATNSALSTVSNVFYYWNVDTNAWQILTSTGSTARRGHAMASISGTGVNIWGGYNGSAVIQDHQSFGEAWSNVTDTTAPAARRSVVSVYANSKWYIFAGRPNTGTWYKDTWSRTSITSSGAWTNENPPAFMPAWFAYTGGTEGNYHWQVWGVENGTKTSDFMPFPTSGNLESATDFALGTGGPPQYTISHTTSANKNKQGTASHTTSANKKKAATASHTTSANLVDEVWTYEAKATLPTTDALLANSYSDTDRSNVATNDNVFKDLTGSGNLIEQVWMYHTNAVDEINASWSGKTTLAPSSSTVYLQVYNHTTDTWTTLDFDAATAADTEFALTGSQTDSLSEYYDTGNRVALRVYQEVV